MLANKNRFHGHGSLRFVYSKGSIVRTRFFICKTTTNPRRHTPRVAVVVSKKVVKSAVKRNRIRRRMYEVIRSELPKLEPRSDIVFIVVSPELLTIEYDAIHAAITSSCAQADLYKQPKS